MIPAPFARSRRSRWHSPLRFTPLVHDLAAFGGENVKVVSERLGHANVAFTLDVYSRVPPDMQQKAADRMEKLLTTDGQ